MTANRRADLQRKLAMKPVEKPPAGLASRIKNDIPKELRFSAEGERKRFAQSARIRLAVAASVIVVIATAYLGLRVNTKESPTRDQATTTVAAVQRIERTTPAPQAVPQAPVLKPAVVVAERHKTRKDDRPASKVQPETISVTAEAPIVEPQKAAEKEAAADELRNMAVAQSAAPAAAAAAPPPVEVKSEATRSPVSGKLLVVRGQSVMDAAALPAREEMLKKWKDTSAETKIQILKEELARGAEPGEVARVAREAGLNEFADSIERKQH